MNSNFPRILALLRKEKGFSQKQAAVDLGISQALLSHYEKGIRECGLDFVVRVADYYQVSCDYLLGRTPQRDGSVLSADSLPGAGASRGRRGQNSPEKYQQRLLADSTHIVFALLKKINSKNLSQKIFLILSSGVYKAFRLLYSANPKNPQGIFSLNPKLYEGTIDSLMCMSTAESRYILSGESIDNCPGVKEEAFPKLTTEALSQEFPAQAPALFELIQSTENAAKTGG